MKTTLRYLLMMVAVLSALSVSAYAPQYGKTYNPGQQATYQSLQVNAQLPEAKIGSTGSGFMVSGSTLPQAAVTGTTTTADNNSSGRPGHIRKGWGTGGESGEPGDRPEPYETPLGDAAWPLALLACVYALMRVFLIVKRKKQ